MEFPQLKNPLILAPMADVTDLAFRTLCRHHGAAMAYTEQLSALAITKNNPKTLKLAETNAHDTPVGLQLFGRNPDTLADAAKQLGNHFDVIDLNLGCPSKKIIAQGYGSALLQEKETIHDIITTLTSNVNKPITVKMRSGFKKVEALQLVKVIENAGATAITLHARTQTQGYSGSADWNLIKKAKHTVSIPLIGNGDITTPEHAAQRLRETRCDYLMIGRAAKNNPWIFTQILHYLQTGKTLRQTPEEKINLFFHYLELWRKQPFQSFKAIKERALDFTTGLAGSAKLRATLSTIRDVPTLENTLRQYHPRF